jgi:predicted HicB family RNase H-like nuclease
MNDATTTITPTTPPKSNGYLGLYIPSELKLRLTIAAKQADVSLSKYAVRLFKSHLESLPQ